MRCAGRWAMGALVASLLACETPSSSPETTADVPTPAGVPDPDAERFAAPIEEAHGLSAWREKEAFRADVVVTFDGETLLEGTLWMTPDMSRSRIERADGAAVLWDGVDAWVTPPDAEFPRARFHVRTWPYFLSAPMKLRDPGTYLQPLGEKALRGETYEAARLTFGPGVGDTPDDWYILYRDPETMRLHAVAYVVTYGTTLERAEEQPHAITYGAFEEIDGVVIPTEWTFWQWSEDAGIRGEPIGSVTLRDPEFVEPAESVFAVPDGASRRSMPSS